jgi:hypothetical protein
VHVSSHKEPISYIASYTPSSYETDILNTSDNRAMTSLDVSGNNLTKGAFLGYDSDNNEEYATDTTGALELLYCIADRRCVVCRCYRPCQRHPQYGGVDQARY